MTELVRIAEPTEEMVQRSKTVANSGIDVAAEQVGGTPTDGVRIDGYYRCDPVCCLCC